MALAAHPDDIEFLMAGTLLLLGEAGYELHYMTVATGSCGSARYGAAATRRIRRREAQKAARILNAHYHPPLVDDLEILYELPLLRRIAAILREVGPEILLIPSPQDYMEDHTNSCRLAVTAAFARGMPNFRTLPRRRPITGEVTLYHSMPYGLRDPLRRRIHPGLFVDTGGAHARKREALAAHQSQQDWLEASQGVNAYLNAMEEMSREVGRLSGRFEHAEGWRRHLHLGFCAYDADPLASVLGERCLVSQAYEASLDEGPSFTGLPEPG